MAINQETSVEGVLEVLEAELGRSYFNIIHVQAAIHKISVLGDISEEVSESPVLSGLLSRAKALMPGQMSGKDVSAMLWSISRLSKLIPQTLDLLPGLVEMVKHRKVAWNAGTWAYAFSATVLLSEKAPVILEAVPVMLESFADGVAEEMEAKDLGRTLSNLAALHKDVPCTGDVVPLLVDVMLDYGLAGELDAVGVATALWSLNTLGAADQAVDGSSMREVMAELEQRAVKLMSQLRMKGLCQVLWGFALANRLDEATARDIAQMTTRCLHRASRNEVRQYVPAILCALTRLEVKVQPLLDEVSRNTMVLTTLGFMSDWSVCALSWSYQELSTSQSHTRLKRSLADELSARSLTKAKCKKLACKTLWEG